MKVTDRPPALRPSFQLMLTVLPPRSKPRMQYRRGIPGAC